jgi:hypothetical protein
VAHASEWLSFHFQIVHLFLWSVHYIVHQSSLQHEGRSLLSAALTPPPNTKGQVWPSSPPPNSPLIMLFRPHWHHEYWSDDWNNDGDSCVNYCLILFPLPPPLSLALGQVSSVLDKLHAVPLTSWPLLQESWWIHERVTAYEQYSIVLNTIIQ